MARVGLLFIFVQATFKYIIDLAILTKLRTQEQEQRPRPTKFVVLLTGDSLVQRTITRNPLILWNALGNVQLQIDRVPSESVQLGNAI